MNLSKSDLLEIYRQMVLTRLFDLKANEWNLQGKLKESVHQSTGQEAIAIGTCYALRSTDKILPSLRTRGAFFARGVDLKTELRAMAAKKSSSSKGHETSHHSTYPSLGILPGTGMVGSQISIAVGAALALKMKRVDDVVLVYFGDGAANRGDFHEAINLAAVWKLPCIFIVENNQIAETAPKAETTLCKKFSDRALGYGIPGYSIDGNDVLEVFKYTKEAVEEARKGKGPTLLDCVTYRMRPHVGFMAETRPKEEVDAWEGKCPIKKLEKFLIKNNMAEKKELESISSEIDKEIDKVFVSVQSEPNCTMEDMLTDVYEEGSVLNE